MLARCFCAALPDAAAQAGLLEWQQALREAAGLAEQGWVQPTDLHLTLAFLGDLAVEKAREIARAWQAARVAELLPALEFCGLQRWGGRRAVWVAEFQREAVWDAVVEGLVELLPPHGSVLDAAAFRPHVTLWRGSDRAGAAARDLPMFKWPATRLHFDRLVLMARADAGAATRYRILQQR